MATPTPSQPPAPMPPYQPVYPPTPPPKSSRMLIVAVVAVVIVVLIGGLAALALLSAPKPSTPTPPAATVIEPSGTTQEVPSNKVWTVSFTANGQFALTGSFTVSGGSLGVYVMNPMDYANFTVSGIVSQYEWTDGTVTSGSLNALLPAGSWDLMFVNVSNPGTTFVTIDVTSAFTVTPA